MQWIHRFQLFLFDFDGLLVDTEHLHYQAYLHILARRGYQLPLSFTHFFELAHLNATAWREALYAHIPHLDPDWAALYAEKKEAYVQLLLSGKTTLMPGAAPLLEALSEAGIARCVVTNSNREFTQLLSSQIPLLQTIPHWVTREDYAQPKPSPECYLKAIALYGKKGDQIIGFEDSMRGLQALQQTAALPLLICPKYHPLLGRALQTGATHFESLSEIKFLKS